MGEDAAGIGIARVELVGRMCSASIHQVVEIDGEQRRPRADESLSPPAGIEFQIGLRDDVLPAVLVELVDGCHRRALPMSLSGNDSVR